jgi:hypothetical protein
MRENKKKKSLPFGRIHLTICSLKRDLFSALLRPPCSKDRLRVLLRFSPCMAQKSPLLSRFAVFSRYKKENPGI